MAKLDGAEITPAYTSGGLPKLWPIADVLLPVLVEVRLANGGSARIQAPAGMWRQVGRDGLDAELTKPQLEDVMVIATVYVTECFPQLVAHLTRLLGNDHERVTLALSEPELLPRIAYDARLLVTPEAAHVREQLALWRVKSEKKYREVTTAAAAANRAARHGKPRVQAVERAVGDSSRPKARGLFRQAKQLGYDSGATQQRRDEIARRWRERLPGPEKEAS